MLDDEIFRDVTVGSEITQRSGLFRRFVLVRRHRQEAGRQRGPLGREDLLPREDWHAKIEPDPVGVELW